VKPLHHKQTQNVATNASTPSPNKKQLYIGSISINGEGQQTTKPNQAKINKPQAKRRQTKPQAEPSQTIYQTKPSQTKPTRTNHTTIPNQVTGRRVPNPKIQPQLFVSTALLIRSGLVIMSMVFATTFVWTKVVIGTSRDSEDTIKYIYND
jgi:hypothetical protein